MSTNRQIEANRRNARKSTGPTSPEGKAVSALNALKSGIDAKSLILPNESQSDLEQLTLDLYQEHRPATAVARAFVDEVVYCEWILRRLRVAETQMWLYQNNDIYRDPEKYPLGKSASLNYNGFSRIQHRLDANRRARLRALDELKKLPPRTDKPDTDFRANAPEPEPEPTPPTPGAQPPALTPTHQVASPKIGFVPPLPTATPPQPAPAPETEPSSSPGDAQAPNFKGCAGLSHL